MRKKKILLALTLTLIVLAAGYLSFAILIIEQFTDEISIFVIRE